jgi:hypothetical protein
MQAGVVRVREANRRLSETKKTDPRPVHEEWSEAELKDQFLTSEKRRPELILD